MLFRVKSSARKIAIGGAMLEDIHGLDTAVVGVIVSRSIRLVLSFVL